MNKHRKLFVPQGARIEQRTHLYGVFFDLHHALMRRDLSASREEIARLEGSHDLARAKQFLDDGMIGAAESEVASFMFQKENQSDTYEATRCSR